MDKSEIISRLKKIGNHAIHVKDESPFVMSLDDGIAVNEAIDMLKEKEPKQVIGIDDSIEGMEVGYCPSCHRAVVNKKIVETKFCKFCGQAVSWK